MLICEPLLDPQNWLEYCSYNNLENIHSNDAYKITVILERNIAKCFLYIILYSTLNPELASVLIGGSKF